MARVGDQLEKVVALHEPGPDDQADGRRPVVAGHHVGGRAERARRLHGPFKLARPPHEAGALACVVAGPVGAYVVARRPRRHIEGDLLAFLSGRQVGEAIDGRAGPPRQVPRRRPRFTVLVDHPPGLDAVRAGKSCRACRCHRPPGAGASFGRRPRRPVGGLGGHLRRRPGPPAGRLPARARTSRHHQRRHQSSGKGTCRRRAHLTLECIYSTISPGRSSPAQSKPASSSGFMVKAKSA